MIPDGDLNRLAAALQEIPVRGGPFRRETEYVKALGSVLKSTDWSVYGVAKPRALEKPEGLSGHPSGRLDWGSVPSMTSSHCHMRCLEMPKICQLNSPKLAKTL